MSTSKTGTGLGTLAALACVACCALPLMIAAGVLSGGLAAFFADSMPVIAVVLGVLAVAAFAFAARRKAAGAGCGGDTCSTQGGCGCSTTKTTS